MSSLVNDLFVVGSHENYLLGTKLRMWTEATLHKTSSSNMLISYHLIFLFLVHCKYGKYWWSTLYFLHIWVFYFVWVKLNINLSMSGGHITSETLDASYGIIGFDFFFPRFCLSSVPSCLVTLVFLSEWEHLFCSILHNHS